MMLCCNISYYPAAPFRAALCPCCGDQLCKVVFVHFVH
jgi:hypothetical protein